MGYQAKDIRNICLLGHGGDGKTSLVESMLFLTKGIDRLGKTTDGNTASDYDQEEIKRGYSISTTVLPVEYQKSKLNILDNPGYFDFAGEVMQSLSVSDAGVVLVSGKGGLTVGAEKSWRYLKQRELPRFIYVSKMDEEHADFIGVVNALREKFGISVVPVVLPIMEGTKPVGYVDVIRKTAHSWKDGKTAEMAIPGDLESETEEYFEMICEAVAETDEALMEKYFEDGAEAFSHEEIINGVRTAVQQCTLAPVFCGSAVNGFGTLELIQGLIDMAPNPLEGKGVRICDAEGKDAGMMALEENGSPALYVFKTISDQYGKKSYFKVISGTITPDLSLSNVRASATEKLGHIYMPKGKKDVEVTELCCGDIGVVTKLASVKTGDALCTAGKPIYVKGADYAEPCHTMAIFAKVKGQEDKVAAGLTRLAEEDLSFVYTNNAETKEMILSGAGDIHLDVLCSKLKNKFNVEVELRPAKIAYREKIRKKVQVRGRHKKQSGGHGQFGDVVIEFEPGDSEELVFEERVVGGSVPKNFFPAVEKGLRDAVSKGVLAGYPVVFLKATLVDGSYHPVDSSEMAFKTAASLAYKEGLPKANPVLLEPIGKLEVTVPDAYMGDIMSDISKRNGRVLGMNPNEDGEQVVEAEVPMGEMSSYATDLRSMTQGRGYFSFKFERYEEAPALTQQKVIEEAKKAAEAE